VFVLLLLKLKTHCLRYCHSAFLDVRFCMCQTAPVVYGRFIFKNVPRVLEPPYGKVDSLPD